MCDIRNTRGAQARFGQNPLHKLGHVEFFPGVAQKFEQIEFRQPIVIVDELELLPAEKPRNLPRERRFILCDLLERQQIALGRIAHVADLPRAAADEQNDFVAAIEKASREHVNREVPDVQTVRARVCPEVKRKFFVVDEPRIRERVLPEKAAIFQFFAQFHADIIYYARDFAKSAGKRLRF